jgi:uncharacterized membrane protein
VTEASAKAEQRFWRGWSDAELQVRLVRLMGARRTAPRGWPMAPPWRAERSESVVAHEAPGPPSPGGPFLRARQGVARFSFSDPSIVAEHSFPGPLLGRRMLLELKALGLRYLCGVKVREVEEHSEQGLTRFGFRYDTLTGHIERGAEWFVLEKDHESGEVRFFIRSTWRHGDFPNLYSEVGFSLLSPYYRRLWLRRAHERLSALAQVGTPTPGTAATGPARRRHALWAALAVGGLTGLRSMSGPALLAFEELRSGPPESGSLGERVLGAPSASFWLGAAALSEAIADKHPRVPSRVSPAPLAGRLGLGALAGSVVAKRSGTPVARAALAGALAAGLTAFAGYALRTRLARRGVASQARLGLVEDGLVLAAALALASSERRPLARHVRRGPDRAPRR